MKSRVFERQASCAAIRPCQMGVAKPRQRVSSLLGALIFLPIYVSSRRFLTLEAAGIPVPGKPSAMGSDIEGHGQGVDTAGATVLHSCNDAKLVETERNHKKALARGTGRGPESALFASPAVFKGRRPLSRRRDDWRAVHRRCDCRRWAPSCHTPSRSGCW